MESKAKRITGWFLTGLVGLFLIGASGIPKFIDFPHKKEMFDKLGAPLELAPTLGVIEVAVAILFPIIIGVVMWVALGLRQPAIFALATGKSLSPSDSGAVQS